MARREKLAGRAGRIAAAVLVTLPLLHLPAGAAGEADGKPAFPRFASLRADRVNLRSGPGARYPVEWVYTRRNLPVELLVAVDHYLKVRDWDGTLGWVHEKMVWNRRDVIVKGAVRALRQRPDPAAPVVARAEPGVIGRLLECQGGWCRIEAGDYTGWLQRGDVFGVFPDEPVP
jgi:SH3-like domain-containing protein